MHELSIAQGIFEIVRQYVPAPEDHPVLSVRVRVGEQAGIVADSLSFCFDAITLNTPYAGTTLSIEHVPFTLRCASCGTEFQSESGMVLCTACGSTDTTVIAGTELQVIDIELADEPAHAAAAAKEGG